ncbi:MAG: hypothetical protein FWC32_04850 [Firmicutes bacterium]|nr:hypothetical protein [Bacillota bacterium]
MNLKRNIVVKDSSPRAVILGVTIAVAILGLLGWGVFVVVRLLWRWLQELVYTVSAMDTVIIIALISGTITIFGLIINSILSLHIKNSEVKFKRKAVLLKKLEGPYTQFVNMLFDMVHKKEDVEKIDEEVRIRLLRDMSREIILYGSDKVVKKWVDYRKKSSNFSVTEHLIYLEGLLHLIREDMGNGRGELMVGDLLSLFASDVEIIPEEVANLHFGGLKMSWTSDDGERLDEESNEDESLKEDTGSSPE